MLLAIFLWCCPRYLTIHTYEIALVIKTNSICYLLDRHKEAKSGKNPNKVYDDIDELFKDLDSDK